MAPPRPQTIPVFLLVRTAYQLLWQQRDDALRLGFVPTLICFGGLLYSEDLVLAMSEQMQAGMEEQMLAAHAFPLIVTGLVSLLAVLLLLANWLRFTLLGPMAAVGLGLGIGRPHVAFALAMAVLGFAAGIAISVICMPLVLLPATLANIGSVIVFIVIMVALARLMPFPVGQAIGQPISLQQAWQASRGNGIALLTALILVQMPLWILYILLNDLLVAVGFASVAPLAMLFIASVFQSAAAILHAIVLATVFRQLVGIRV
jgi:hypothetical protein